MSCINSGSAARLVLASVKKLKGYLYDFCQVISSGNIFFTFKVFPIKLSSTIKIGPLQPALYNAWNSVIICSGDLLRGILPFMMTISQNSQLKGHPLEYCTDRVA